MLNGIAVYTTDCFFIGVLDIAHARFIKVSSFFFQIIELPRCLNLDIWTSPTNPINKI